MKKILFAIVIFLIFAVDVEAVTKYSIPGAGGTGCSNGSSNYSAASNTCGAGSSTVYTNLRNGMKALAAGDTLAIRAGNYSGESTFGNTAGDVIASGSSWSTATIVKPYNNETVNMPAMAIGWPSGGSPYNYVVFGDSTCADGSVACSYSMVWDGVGPYFAFGHHIRIVNTEIKNATGISSGLQCTEGSSNGWIDHNKVHNNGTSSNPVQAHGIYCYGQGHLIEYNEVYSNYNYGIHSYNGTPNTNDGQIIRYNYVHNNGTDPSGAGYGIILSASLNGQVYGNVAHANSEGGILIDYGAPNGVKVFNNTTASSPSGNGIIIGSEASNTVVRNNASMGNGASNYTNAGSNTTASNNLTSGTLGSFFVDATNGNYSLVAGAATAIDSGIAAIATGVTACANGSAPDIGAIESLPQPTASIGADGTAVKITVTNNCAVHGILPLTGATGFSFKRNGSSDAITGSVVLSGQTYLAVLTDAFTAGQTCTFSYAQSSGNVFANYTIGNVSTSNQELFDFTDAACTNGVSASGSNLSYTHGRWYLLQGATDTDWIPKGLDDANVTAAPGSKLNLRWKVKNTGDATSLNPRFRVSYDGGSYVELTSSYVNAIRALGSGAQLGTVMSDGSAMTADQLPSDVANVACTYIRNPIAAPNLTLGTNTEAECGLAVDFDTTATVGKQYNFKLYDDVGTAITGGPISVVIGSYESVR